MSETAESDIDIADRAAWQAAEAELSKLEAEYRARVRVNLRPGDTIQQDIQRARERVEHYRFFWVDSKLQPTHADRLRHINARNREFWNARKEQQP